MTAKTVYKKRVLCFEMKLMKGKRDLYVQIKC